MKSRALAILKITIFVLAGFLGALAQSTGVLRGTVTDPSGAVVQNASVVITGPSGQVLTSTTRKSGAFEIKNLPPGKYSIDASAAGFSINVLPVVEILPGKTVLHDIKFDIAVQQEKINVEESGTGIDVSPSNNAGALILKGKDLDALSDDPDELMSDLQALAGPALLSEVVRADAEISVLLGQQPDHVRTEVEHTRLRGIEGEIFEVYRVRRR